MSIDGINDSRFVRAKTLVWDDSNRGFLQLEIFLFSRLGPSFRDMKSSQQRSYAPLHILVNVRTSSI